jgi:uncharacterized alkaline shock family protein YloU
MQGNVKVNPMLIQIEAICIPGYGAKISNYNTQITNNIKNTNSNDQTISITYWMSLRHFSCFEFWSLIFV